MEQKHIPAETHTAKFSQQAQRTRIMSKKDKPMSKSANSVTYQNNIYELLSHLDQNQSMVNKATKEQGKDSNSNHSSQQTWKKKENADINNVNSSFAKLTVQEQKQAYVPKKMINEHTLQKQKIPPFIYQYLGKVLPAMIKQYINEGAVLEFFTIPAYLQNQSDTFYGFLPWSAFHSTLVDISSSQRRQLMDQRVPVGSKLNVFINSVESNKLLITLAHKTSLKLNHQPITLNDNNSTENNTNILSQNIKKSSIRYLIVVDLEATCDYSPQPSVDHTTAEIIEFPWIVFDTHSLEILHEKQLYVKPDNMKGITPYCRVLTGITEDVVEDGCTLKSAIDQFNEYVTSNLEPGSFRILTDGIWDLQVQLKSEAKRKNIPLAKWYMDFVDLKQEFRKYLPMFPYGPREPPLHEMLQALNLNFVGRHHVGLDDCRSIVQILKELLVRGHSFDDSIQIDEAYDYQLDSSYVGFSSLCPPGSWKCVLCTSKHKDKDGDNPNRAVWNKAFQSTCRFCNNPQQLEVNNGQYVLECQVCTKKFALLPSEVEFFQSKKYQYPKKCEKCRVKQ